MKITLITQHFAPHFEGGTESLVRAQALELLRGGHEVRVVSGTDRPRAAEDLERLRVDDIETVFVPRTEREPYDLTLRRPRVRALVERLCEGAELVHLHHWGTLDGALVRTLARSCPVVVTLHDLFVTCPRFFRRPLGGVERCPERGDFEPCARCVSIAAPGVSLEDLESGLRERATGFQAELNSAARVVVPSRAHAERLATQVSFAPGKLVVSGHGLLVPIERLSDARWGGAGPLRLLYLGHRAEVKGLRDLVRGLASLTPEERARVELHLLGEEVEAGFDGSLLAEAGDVALRFHDGYRLEEISERLTGLGGAHLAVLPSRVEESYGLVVDEALALGLPVWVSDRGAPRERIGASGRVLPAEDPAGWRDALREVLDRPDILERERLAIPASSRTVADAALELERLYRQLLETA